MFYTRVCFDELERCETEGLEDEKHHEVDLIRIAICIWKQQVHVLQIYAIIYDYMSIE